MKPLLTAYLSLSRITSHLRWPEKDVARTVPKKLKFYAVDVSRTWLNGSLTNQQ